MVTAVIGRSLQILHKSSRFVCTIAFPRQGNPILLNSKQRMATAADLARIKAKAEKTEKILVNLQNQIEAVKRAAAKQAGLGEEEELVKENEELKKEIEAIKKELILAEIGNGVRQVQMPTRGALSKLSASAAVSATVSAPVASESVSVNTQEAKGKKTEIAGKKNKQAGQPEAGGKKPKQEKKEKGGRGEGGGDAKPKKGNATTGGEPGDAAVDVSRLDLRVGKIVAVDKHPDADTLYVEQVDVGEGKNRTIVSGLVKHYPVSAMKDRIAVFMCNLKPAKMRGIFSEGMIMCATGPDKTEILVPPADAAIGDQVTVVEYPGTPDVQLNPKKKIWETVKPDLRTNKDRVASYKGAALQITGKGVVVAPTLADCQIS